MRRYNIKDSILVYSTDPARNKKCEKCGHLVPECICVTLNDAIPTKLEVVLRIEKAERRGKIVTVIDRLPKNDPFLEDLTKFLKKKCGCGGKYFLNTDSSFARIEIQGDHRHLLPEVLAQKGIICLAPRAKPKDP